MKVTVLKLHSVLQMISMSSNVIFKVMQRALLEMLMNDGNEKQNMLPLFFLPV